MSLFCVFLNEENHQKGDDFSAGIDDELPGIGIAEEWTRCGDDGYHSDDERSGMAALLGSGMAALLGGPVRRCENMPDMAGPPGTTPLTPEARGFENARPSDCDESGTRSQKQGRSSQSCNREWSPEVGTTIRSHSPNNGQVQRANTSSV
jgi:hypothetical protein